MVMQRVERQGLDVNAPVWKGGRVYHLPTSLDIPSLKCTSKEGLIVPINGLIDPLKTLWLLI